MRKVYSLKELESLLHFAIIEEKNPNINEVAPCRCNDLGWFKLGFSPTGEITVWKHIGVNEDGEHRYGDALSAWNYHLVYIKCLEYEIEKLKSNENQN